MLLTVYKLLDDVLKERPKYFIMFGPYGLVWVKSINVHYILWTGSISTCIYIIESKGNVFIP